MRGITPGRVIGVAIIIVLVGFLPTVISVGSDIIARTQEWWPAELSLQSYLAHLAEFWRSLVGTFAYVRAAGFILLLVGVMWAVFLRMDRLPWAAPKPPTEPEWTSSVLLQEANAMHGRTPGAEIRQAIDAFDAQRREDFEESNSDAALNEVSPVAYRWLNDIGRTALCLSGGGIRSACFALGVLQALAVHPRRPDNDRHVDSPQNSLLSQFHYLSTVSGGGYIGSWLSAWISRHKFPFVWSCLVRHPNVGRDPGLEPRAIAWLREHGNYLTPQLGLTSPDTLTTVAIFLRNLFLNWLVLLPLLVVPLIVMKLLAIVIFAVGYHNSLPLFFAFGLIGFLFLFSALRFSLRNRPSRNRDGDRRKLQADQPKVIRRGLFPFLGAAFAFTICMSLAAATKVEGKYAGWIGTLFPLNAGRLEVGNLMLVGAVCGALMYALSWLTSWPRVRGTDDFWRWTLAGTIYGVLVGLVVYFFANDYIGDWIFYSATDWLRRLWGLVSSPWATGDLSRQDLYLGPDLYKHQLVLIHLGVPMLLGAQLLAEMLFVGLSSYQQNSDDDREWLGRSAALTLLAGIGWMVLMYLIYVGGDIAYNMIEKPLESLLLFGLLYVTSVIAAALGRSERTSAQLPPPGQKPKPSHTILSMVAIVCALLLIIVTSAVIDLAVLGHPITARAGNSMGLDAFLLSAALLAALLIGVNASKVINVNRFSMHALYRNRLVRTFLGATRDPREANPFTNFDGEDNPRMQDLWSGARTEEREWQPYHVINLALNVTASEKHLAWQERKAAPFVVTPLHCGSAITGFRKSNEYGGERGISLGTAMAISGAAASPNQGYNSSPPVAFLMALLNVRLGWWLGNPGRAGSATYRDDGPKTAARSLVAELLGSTREDKEYVYLSDGGHFENLGIYEMVRRRCRLIVVSDAGCDPDHGFEDLGNAVRKIQIDLGIPIHFEGLEALKPRPADGRDLGPGHPYHVVGEIDYPAADGEGGKGMILYIKPGYHGTEAVAGVRSYANANADFPHDSTANQWFGESQMESYRALGFEIMDNLLREALKSLKDKTEPKLEEVLLAVSKLKPAAAAPPPAAHT
jgi:hypothetical protein